MLLRDLRDANPHLVIVGGEIAGRDGEPEFENEDEFEETCRDTVRLHPSLRAGNFRLPAGGGEGRLDGTAVVRAMEMYDGYFKKAFEARHTSN